MPSQQQPISKKNIIYYLRKLLPYSQTFIPAQGESLSAYRVLYVGIDRVTGNNNLLPEERIITFSEVALWELFWKRVFYRIGIIPPHIVKQLKTLSPSLIHAHFGPPGIQASILSQKLRIPLIVTFRGYDVTREESTIHYAYQQRRQQMFKKASCCIAVSEFIGSKLIEKGCPPDKIIVHYTGIDVDKFTPDPEVLRKPTVLFVGRLIQKKGCEYLIRAMAKVQQVMPHVELVIIGDGELRYQLEKLAADSLSRYRFLGVQSPAQVKAWMNRVFLLVSPSVTSDNGDAEGLPNVILEAQAMGLSVVASLHAGIPEAITNGETGFLIRERDWETLAKYILTLLQNAQLRERFALAGRKQIEQKFHLKRNTAKLEEIYNSILEG